ncbi:hypothetical protein L596_000804 [Steinernema carpocapsae]|uniref:SKP1 component POZ domain-containing protein n=1 Tax=Steinernema carpocapsae TaxID=34508 RepID=A0A4U8UJ64_STECR|nr:hypothetical protein L596_000804 [Steinernema carpocapsae]
MDAFAPVTCSDNAVVDFKLRWISECAALKEQAERGEELVVENIDSTNMSLVVDFFTALEVTDDLHSVFQRGLIPLWVARELRCPILADELKMERFLRLLEENL